MRYFQRVDELLLDRVFQPVVNLLFTLSEEKITQFGIAKQLCIGTWVVHTSYIILPGVPGDELPGVYFFVLIYGIMLWGRHRYIANVESRVRAGMRNPLRLEILERLVAGIVLASHACIDISTPGVTQAGIFIHLGNFTLLCSYYFAACDSPTRLEFFKQELKHA